MRILLCLIILGTPLLAGAYSCPSYLQDSEKAQAAHHWLSRFAHQTELHGCQLEIRVCDPNAEPNDLAPIGEVLVQTPEGREAYVSVDFPHEKTWRFRTKVKSYTRAFYYRKKDRFYEPIEGRTEVWQLEFRTLWEDPTVLDHLDLGIYSTYSQLNQANGNDSHWYNCARPD